MIILFDLLIDLRIIDYDIYLWGFCQTADNSYYQRYCATATSETEFNYEAQTFCLLQNDGR